VGEGETNASGGGHGLGRNQHALDRFTAVTELPMLVVTVLWLPVLIVPILRPVNGSVAAAVSFIDYSVWALFALEYLTKIYLAPDRWRFVRGHISDLIIVAIPFFRPARLARITQLGRVALLVERGRKRFRSLMTHQGLHFVLPSVALIVFCSAWVVTVAERHAHGSNIHNLGDGLWWAIVTVATVGYGDTSPVTPIGRGVAVFLMLAGIGLIGILSATVASYFVGQNLAAHNAGQEAGKVEAEQEEQENQEKLRQEVAIARAERDELAAKLDRLSEQMDRLLVSLSPNGEGERGSGEDPQPEPAGTERRRRR